MSEPGQKSRPVTSMTMEELVAELEERRQKRSTASTRVAARKARKEPLRDGDLTEEEEAELKELLG